MKTTADEILLLLKTRGPARTGDIATRLGITRQGARQQLERLAADGLVAAEPTRGAVGRPRHLWSLTEAGHRRFPDTHAQMTVELIEAARHAFGDEGLDRLIAERERAAEESYRSALGGEVSLAERVHRLAKLRESEGYMAEWRREDDGSFLLIENHCPICAAARICQGFCRSELSLFRKALGENVSVERVEHLLAGARRCAYRITGRPAT